jgi:hypothetical protein
MSRAFVKEVEHEIDDPPDRPVSMHPNLVTAEGAAIERTLGRFEAAWLAPSRFGSFTAYQPTKPQELCINSCDLRRVSDRAKPPLLRDIDFQRACQPCREFRTHPLSRSFALPK